MSKDNRRQTSFTVDSDALDKAKKKLDHGELSKRLRRAVEEVAYGTETTERARLKEKLETLRSDRREKQQEIENLRHDADELDREITRVENRLDTLMQQDGEYDGFLKSIETDLHDGMRFDPQHGKVEDAAEIGETTPVDVIQDLKERNPDVPDKAFREPEPGEPPKWKDAGTLQSTR